MALTKVSYSMITGEVGNALDYGADNTGIADSTAAIQAAVDSGKSTIFLPAGTYNVTDTIVVPPNVSVVGEGEATIIDATGISTSSTPVMTQTGSVSNTTTLTGNIGVGVVSFAVTSTTGMTVGGWISLYGNTANSWSGPWDGTRDYRKNTFFQIIEINGTTVTVSEPTNTSFQSASTVVSVINPTTAVFRDFKILANTSNLASGLSVDYGLNVLIENVVCYGGDISSLACTRSIHTSFKNCSVYLDAASSSYQYGIAINTSDFTVVDDCDIYATRHAVAIVGDQARRSKIVNSRLRAEQYAADAHGNADDLIYENCVISGGGGILFAGRDVSYINCKISSFNTIPIVLATEIYGGNQTIQGCELVWYGTSLPAGFSPVDFSQSNTINTYTKEDVALNIIDNKFDFPNYTTPDYFIRTRNTSAYEINFNVVNNFVYYQNLFSFVRYEGAPTGGDAGYAVVSNNVVMDASSSYYTFEAGSGASGYATAKLNLTNTYSASAAPSSGYWNRGDIVWNTAPTAGGVPGWVCVTSGNPGTWKAMANLAA